MLIDEQARAEQAVHDALEADDEAALVEFSEFAAQEIDSKHVAALLLSFLNPGNGSRNPAIAAAMSQMSAVNILKVELDRQRAHFIEWKARQNLRAAEQHADAEYENRHHD